MTDTAVNNNRIAKNTLMLYVRMFLIMLVSLYTSRIVLKELGVEDYGIYNVVGGIVTMLSFLNSSLSTATQRYLNYEMGKNNRMALNKVFSMSFISFAILALIAIIIAETVGLWFVYNKLVIPPHRIDAALWVYHLSVMTFAVNMLAIPYTASIVANEKMSVYAYVSIIEVVLKLALVFLLVKISTDKLILYSIMMFAVTCVITSIYRGYCIKKIEECHLKWIWDIKLLRKLFSFSGWMLLGTTSQLISTQGVNILINMFFGPALNTARAVAMQVNTAVYSFSQNFMTAVRPQIIKSYAKGEMRYMYRLVFTSSKLCFYLMFILSLPLILETNFVLNLWLKDVPDFAVLFTRLVLIDLLLHATYTSISYVSQAADATREFQLSISICFLMIFVVTLGAYILHAPAYTTFLIAIIIDIIGLFVRLLVLKKTVQFPVLNYIKNVIAPIVFVTLFSILCLYPIKAIIGNSILSSLIIIFSAVFIPCIFIWFIGIDNGERILIKSMLGKILYRKH